MAREMTWNPDNLRPDIYERLNGNKLMLVRTKPTPAGQYLWSFGGKVYDYAETLEEAREMVEGLALVEGEPG